KRSSEEEKEVLRANPALNGAERQAAIDAIEAMSHNWRWLHAAAERTADRQDATPAELSAALEWAESAVRIHDDRCPMPEICTAGWYALNVLGNVPRRWEQS